MSKRYVIIPNGWKCTLLEAPPGPFVCGEEATELCFKTEYRQDDGRVMAYNSAGEFFCAEGNDTIVQPVMVEVEDE